MMTMPDTLTAGAVGIGRDAHELASEARGRQAVYALLGRLFERELDVEELLSLASGEGVHVLSSLADAGVASGAVKRIICATAQPDEKTAEQIAIEFARLFLTHDRIHPHASCWMGERSQLMGDAWRAAVEFYHREGLAPRPEDVWCADNVGAQLYFASIISSRVADPPNGQLPGQVEKVLVEYLTEHVMPWVPRFFDRVASDPRADFYREAALVGLAFLEMDAFMLGIVPKADCHGAIEEVRR